MGHSLVPRHRHPQWRTPSPHFTPLHASIHNSMCPWRHFQTCEFATMSMCLVVWDWASPMTCFFSWRAKHPATSWLWCLQWEPGYSELARQSAALQSRDWLLIKNECWRWHWLDCCSHEHVNPLEFRGSFSATSTNMKLVHWPLMGGLSEVGTWLDRSLPRPLLAVPNVTAHPSTATVPITVYCCIMVRCSAVLVCP